MDAKLREEFIRFCHFSDQASAIIYDDNMSEKSIYAEYVKSELIKSRKRIEKILDGR